MRSNPGSDGLSQQEGDKEVVSLSSRGLTVPSTYQESGSRVCLAAWFTR